MNATNGIQHIAVTEPTNLEEFLLPYAQSREQVGFWLYHGCVYVDGIRRRENISLAPQQIVRLHPNPKRYYWEITGVLKDRIVFEHPDFFVLDKPPGLPVHPTLDNYLDNAKYILEKELKSTVYSTHRLDVPTRGLLIFAKNPTAQSRLNKIFAKRQVEKIYHATVTRPVALGEHVLYLNPTTRVPREHSFAKVEGWWECRLEVLDVTIDAKGYRCQIRLITGKTHQIRAQLSALGSPILGDPTYGYIGEESRLHLECARLSFRFQGQDFTIELGQDGEATSPSGERWNSIPIPSPTA